MQIYKTFCCDSCDFQKKIDDEFKNNNLELKTFSVSTNYKDAYTVYHCIFEEKKTD